MLTRVSNYNHLVKYVTPILTLTSVRFQKNAINGASSLEFTNTHELSYLFLQSFSSPNCHCMAKWPFVHGNHIVIFLKAKYSWAVLNETDKQDFIEDHNFT